LKVHLVLLVVYFSAFIAETLHNGKGFEDQLRPDEDSSSTQAGWNCVVNEELAAVLSVS
jgi:hypothetical protein